MNKIKLYIQETYNELIYKVTWPTWADLQNSAVVVAVASVIIALIVLVMDLASKGVLRNIYKVLGGGE